MIGDPLDDVCYVIPLRWRAPQAIEEMTDYLRWVSTLVAQVVVVDGSAQPIFDRHHGAWSSIVTHVAPDADLEFVFGKVNGVHTGMRLARCERVVLADDDVRYDERSLRQVVGLLEAADLVRPQNYFSPTPWHAYWDTARTLLNRVSGGDFPGTLAVRHSAYWHTGGYDGNVLFENLELERTIEAGGGRVIVALDCYVRRLPPTALHFRSQRVRQAYDEFARPARLVGALAIAPGLIALSRRGGVAPLAVAAAGVVVAAEVGRRRKGGTRVFSPVASLLAPAWVLERAVCSWLAVAQRARRGGVVYGDVVIARAANSPRKLRRRIIRRGAPSASPSRRMRSAREGRADDAAPSSVRSPRSRVVARRS